MFRFRVFLGLLMAVASSQMSAQEQHGYVVGIRSAVIIGKMHLSNLDPAFENLAYDGVQGPHMSGFFLLYRVRPHVRIGGETLVSNSDQNAATTMNYQAAGPSVELSLGDTWFVSGGVHAGGLIVNAMARENTAQPERTTSGTYYKGNGLFIAPSIDAGVRFRRGEFGVFAKRVSIAGEKGRGGMPAFSSAFGGLRVAFRL